MALAASRIPERKRVKVYELRETDWHDRGTGFCAASVISDDCRIHVESEESPDQSLLNILIKKDDNYQKQQETLIVWTDPESVDMALSFQEAEGCSGIWEAIRDVQEKLGGRPPPSQHWPTPSMTKETLDTIEQRVKMGATTPQNRDHVVKFVTSTNYILQMVPVVHEAEDMEDLEGLHQLCNIVKQLILFNDSAIIEQIVHKDVFHGVIGALEYDPDFPNHKANHRQFFEETAKFKEVVDISDEEIKNKIHYTYRLQYLKDVALARILDDPSFSLFNSMIYFHHIDIIQWISANKPFLDDLFLIFHAQNNTSLQKRKDAMAFVQHCCQIAKTLQAPLRNGLYHNLLNAGLFPAITFALQSRDSGVRVAGTDVLVAIIDHDMMMMRSHIHKAANDFMSPITDTLIDLFLVESDFGVKAQVADAIKVLLDTNPTSALDRAFSSGPESFAARRSSAMNNANRAFLENHLEPSMQKLFQPLLALNMRQPLDDLSPDQAALYTHLVDILAFFVRQPNREVKIFIITEGLIPKAARFLTCTEKHLKLTAIKFFRTCILVNDPGETYQRSLINNAVFDTLLTQLLPRPSGSPYTTAAAKPRLVQPRDNLLTSAILSLFDTILIHRIRSLILHLVETHREKLEAITYVPLFSDLLRRYEILMHPENFPSDPVRSDADDPESSFLTSDAGSPPNSQQPGNGHGQGSAVNGGVSRWAASLQEDPDEDAYFRSEEEDDADEDALFRELESEMTPERLLKSLTSDRKGRVTRLPKDRSSSNGASGRQGGGAGPNASAGPSSGEGLSTSPISKPLVDYGDDDSDENEPDELGIEEAIAETPPRRLRLNASAQSTALQGSKQDPNAFTGMDTPIDMDIDTPDMETSSSPSPLRRTGTASAADSSPDGRGPPSSDTTASSPSGPPPSSAQQQQHTTISPATTTPIPTQVKPPPISQAEKRRREHLEEDDEDELGKLSQAGSNKRRNSAGPGLGSGARATGAGGGGGGGGGGGESEWSEVVGGDDVDGWGGYTSSPGASSPGVSSPGAEGARGENARGENAKGEKDRGRERERSDTSSPRINVLRRRPRQSFGKGSASTPSAGNGNSHGHGVNGNGEVRMAFKLGSGTNGKSVDHDGEGDPKVANSEPETQKEVEQPQRQPEEVREPEGAKER